MRESGGAEHPMGKRRTPDPAALEFMRLLRKKTELETISTLARLVESLRWYQRLVEHYERRIAELESQVSGQQAVRETPSCSKYVH